jgi:hypothetical protein
MIDSYVKAPCFFFFSKGIGGEPSSAWLVVAPPLSGMATLEVEAPVCIQGRKEGRKEWCKE